MIQVSLSPSQFSEFLRCLSLLKDICNDVDIREGIIRQRTNNHSCIFEIDLKSIVTDIDMPISNLKQKLELLKCFENQEVNIKSDGTKFSFFDQFSVIEIVSPMLQLMDNKFVSQDEFDKLFSLEENNIILDCQIEKLISDRIRVISQVFNVNSLQVTFSNNSANISVSSQSKDQFAMFLSNIPSNIDVTKNCNLIVTPFIIDHDGDIRFEMFNTKDNLVDNKFSTSIGDISVNVFSKTRLTDNEIEE